MQIHLGMDIILKTISPSIVQGGIFGVLGGQAREIAKRLDHLGPHLAYIDLRIHLGMESGHRQTLLPLEIQKSGKAGPIRNKLCANIQMDLRMDTG